jgi:hypothetical protein
VEYIWKTPGKELAAHTASQTKVPYLYDMPRIKGQ